MYALGYLYKKVQHNSGWIETPHVKDVYALSGCVTEHFCDYINYWKHNGFWLFDRPEIMEELAGAHHISLDGLRLFYYEAFEEEYDEVKKVWQRYCAEKNFVTNVEPPKSKKLEGFDVVCYANRNSPQCSPLSCNALAETIPTNEHCLIETFEEAWQAVDDGRFNGSEPGPFRIVAVYSVDASDPAFDRSDSEPRCLE